MIAGIAVSPMNSGWPISQPRVPPASIRAPTVSCVPSGSPLTCNTCRMPVIDHDHRDTAGDPARTLFRIGLGAHQDDRDHHQRDREDDGEGTDPDPDRVVGDRPDRAGGLQPRSDRTHHGQRDQAEGDAVTAVHRVDVPGRGGTPADRPHRAAEPARAHQPQPLQATADALDRGDDRRGLVRRLAGRAGRRSAVRGLCRSRPAGRGLLRRRRPATRRPGRPRAGAAGRGTARRGCGTGRPGSGAGARGSGGLSRHEATLSAAVTPTPSATPAGPPGACRGVPNPSTSAQCAASWVCCLAGVIFRHTQLAGTCRS